MQQRIINILFGVVIVILTGTVVYLTFGSKSTPTTDTATTPTKTTTEPPVAVDETADWKTYTHTESGYSFKYPSTYTVKTVGPEAQVYTSSNSESSAWTIDFFGTKTETTLDSIIKEKTDSKIFGEATPTIINGFPAYEGVIQGMISWYGVFVKNNSGLVKITFSETNKGSLQQDKSALTSIQKSILSSFKFTDQASDSASLIPINTQRQEEPFTLIGKRPTLPNAELYKGYVVVEGTFYEYYPETMGGGTLFFQVDEQYKTKLPKKYNEYSTVFYFNNASLAQQMLKIDESVFNNKSICELSGKAKISIEGFTTELLEGEVWDHTNFVQVLSSTSQTTKTCTER